MSGNMWIVDTDAGVDDAQALVIALNPPAASNFEVVAITTVCGNVSLAQANQNVAEILRVSNKINIPYYSGAEKPLINKLVDCSSIHGADGLNNYWDLPGKSTDSLPKPQNTHAVQAIIDMANRYPGQLNICFIGPLTNLALAVCLDPQLPEKLKRVLIMGAAVHGKGNITVAAEFNVWCDPEASHIVFERFPILEIIPWETCIASESKFSSEFLHRYTSLNTPCGSFINEITKVHEGDSTVFFCDPITLCVAIDETVIKEYSYRHGQVELSGQFTRGMTVVNWQSSDMKSVNSATPNLKIVEKLDIDKIMALFMNSIS